jgi:hypothetical protein
MDVTPGTSIAASPRRVAPQLGHVTSSGLAIDAEHHGQRGPEPAGWGSGISGESLSTMHT